MDVNREGTGEHQETGYNGKGWYSSYYEGMHEELSNTAVRFFSESSIVFIKVSKIPWLSFVIGRLGGMTRGLWVSTDRQNVTSPLKFISSRDGP